MARRLGGSEEGGRKEGGVVGRVVRWQFCAFCGGSREEGRGREEGGGREEGCAIDPRSWGWFWRGLGVGLEVLGVVLEGPGGGPGVGLEVLDVVLKILGVVLEGLGGGPGRAGGVPREDGS